MKSVLLHIKNDAGLDARTEAALAIARAFNGHLSCVHATSPQAYVAFDNFGGVFVMGDVIQKLEEQEKKIRAETEAKMSGEDVSWDYKQMTAEISGAMIHESNLNDLIVMGHPSDPKQRGLANSFIGDVLMHVRIPVLVVPDNAKRIDFRNVAMVAWDGSREAANALRQAVPLLGLATDVHIVTVEDEKEALFPSTAASEYLSRHGIQSELHDHKADKVMVEYELERYAKNLSADYLVMGAFSRSRAREYIFGGVTRYMLHDAAMPLLLAH
jgi:nucleotide-binding universal stress UspA family protein